MESKYWYLIIGIGIGWITKVPFLIKWYRELRKTRSYERMQDAIHYKKVKDLYDAIPKEK